MNKIAIMLVASISFLLASCGQGDILYADKAVVNLSPVAAHPSAGYMNLHGGPVDVAHLMMSCAWKCTRRAKKTAWPA